MLDRDRHYIIPPDGGWGWVVVAAAFMICAVVDGIAMNGATIYVSFPSFMRQYAHNPSYIPSRCFSSNGELVECPGEQVSNSSDGWDNKVDGELNESFSEPMANFFIGATLISIYMLIGPFAAALINVYGSRKIIITGSIIATIGFCLSSLLIEYERFLLITHGIAGGVGLGLMNVGAIVSVGLYFDTRRSLAIGLALCGSGVGMTVAPLVIESIIREHGLYYAYVIFACFSMHGVVAGALVRPLQPRPADHRHFRQKDVVDRVLEWSKNVKHIRTGSMNSLNSPDTKQEVLKKRSQRIRRLEIDSAPTSNAGSRSSVNNNNNDSQDVRSPVIRLVPEFCQVFGSDLLSPLPTVTHSGNTATTEISDTGSSRPQSSDCNCHTENDPQGNYKKNNPQGSPGGFQVSPHSVFFLTLPIPMPTNENSSKDPVWIQGDRRSFIRPATCVCSMLLDGSLLVSEVVLSKTATNSCPDFPYSIQISDETLTLKQRVVATRRHKSQPQPCEHSTTNIAKKSEPVEDKKSKLSIVTTPKRTRRSVRRRRFSSDNSYSARGGESIALNDNPASATGEVDEDDFLPEVVISNVPPIPRQTFRRRTGAIYEEDLLPQYNDDQLGHFENVLHDSGNSSANSESSSVGHLFVDDTVLNIEPTPESLLLSKHCSDAFEFHPVVANGEGRKNGGQKRWNFRLKKRVRGGGDIGSLAQPQAKNTQQNLLQHLLFILEAILDISLLKDIRFWLILLSNLLLMITFLLLPLNADVVKTVRALEEQPAFPQSDAWSAQKVLPGNNNESLQYYNNEVDGLADANNDVLWTPEDREDVMMPDIYEPMPHMYAILLSICGGTQTLIRAMAGFFADYPKIDGTVMIVVAMAIGSLAYFLLGFEAVLQLGIGVFFVLLVVVSACSGVFFALATTVIVDTFGVNRLTSCFGMITMVRGLAPYVTIGFMLSSSFIESIFVGQSENPQLLPFRVACVICSILVLICSLLHFLLFWLNWRQALVDKTKSTVPQIENATTTPSVPLLDNSSNKPNL